MLSYYYIPYNLASIFYILFPVATHVRGSIQDLILIHFITLT